jgi:hypothetical protein
MPIQGKILNIPEITPELRARIEFLQKLHEEDILLDFRSTSYYVFGIDNISGEVLTFNGPCGALPSRSEMQKMKAYLGLLEKEPEDKIELYNLLAEAEAYGPMIDEMLAQSQKRKQKSSSTEGYVYLIDDGYGNVKIGRTSNWKKQTSIDKFGPRTKTLLILKVEDSAQALEGLQVKFQNKKIQGSWYQLNSSDIDVIRQEYRSQIVSTEDTK